MNGIKDRRMGRLGRRRTMSMAVSILALISAGFAPLSARQESSVSFIDIATEVGLDFHHQHGGSPEKYLPETMGAGALVFDYDGDGWLDIFFVNGGSFVDPVAAAEAQHRLYHNNGDGTFTDVTEGSGVKISGYGMGACAADYDNDDRVDLYVTSYGPNRLYHNNGDGTFTDVTETAGTGSELWSTSCAFGDIDNDGDVDLYVASYVDFSPETNGYCGDHDGDLRIYCHPNVYNSLPDVLYRNDGDGTFTDVTDEAGVYNGAGNGLGVVFGDYDLDGWNDIYVANDSVPNFLFHNRGDGTFEDLGLIAGVSVGNGARPLAGMGTDMGDVTGDGLPEIFVTNLDQETHNLYENMGGGLFKEVTFPSGVGEVTLAFVGFGAAFLDYDNDTDLDLAIANGDVIDNVSMTWDYKTYEQRNLLLANDGTGQFADVGLISGPGFEIEKASRALAVGDLDNDGDVDIVISNVGQTPNLLRNDGGNDANALLVDLVGTRSNRDGIGARLRLSVGSQVLVREVRAGSSYLAQNDSRVHFGLGSADVVDQLEILWPGGETEVLEDIDANQILTVREGGGIVDRRPFEGRERTSAPSVAGEAPEPAGRLVESER